MKQELRYPVTVLGIVALVTAWSAIHPFDSFTWLLEAFPVLIIVPILIATYGRFRLSDFLYGAVGLHCIILLIGGHYTYAEVPAFNWLRDEFQLSRNHYDRVGHFIQGAVPALFIREMLLRTSPLTLGKWLFAIIVFSCLGISASYELLEWAVAEATGEAADAFLGTQGDVWDTQKDMALAGIGAILSLLCFSKLHDHSLQVTTDYRPTGIAKT